MPTATRGIAHASAVVDLRTISHWREQRDALRAFMVTVLRTERRRPKQRGEQSTRRRTARIVEDRVFPAAACETL